MNYRIYILSFVLVLAVILAACTASGQPTDVTVGGSAPSSDEMKDQEGETEMSDDMQGDEKSSEMKDDESMSDGETNANMQDGDSSDEAMTGDNSNEMMDDEDGESMNKNGSMDEASKDGDESNMNETNEMSENSGTMDVPGFFNVTLVEVTTGETFQIDDYTDKVVLVETMAVWCSVCLRQQKEVKVLHGLVGERDDFISLGLDIDPNENVDDLRSYVASNGFDWIYTVAPVEVAREIGQLYGAQFLNPPSAPMFIIDRHGEVHPLPFGVKSADQLYEALQMYLEGGM